MRTAFIRLAIGSALFLLGACSAQSAAEPKHLALYSCADGRTFTVEQSAELARITYYNQHFRLPRRPSGIGVKYASPDATLIIDGDMAVFVTESLVDLERCRIAPV